MGYIFPTGNETDFYGSVSKAEVSPGVYKPYTDSRGRVSNRVGVHVSPAERESMGNQLRYNARFGSTDTARLTRSGAMHRTRYAAPSTGLEHGIAGTRGGRSLGRGLDTGIRQSGGYANGASAWGGVSGKNIHHGTPKEWMRHGQGSPGSRMNAFARSTGKKPVASAKTLRRFASLKG